MVSAQRLFLRLLLFAVSAFFFGCGDDTAEEESPSFETESPAVKAPSASPKSVEPAAPQVVYIEELDQFQEYFKEQHDTSFSHTRNKNYCSFTAGKAGMPMRITLYGKPHFATSDFYGSSMSGVLREGNPERGRSIAKWSLSRVDIVSQLASQGLSEVDYGWIDLKFQEPTVPLEVGNKYFVVCERIADGKHFFGAFSFGEGNPYAGGRHWLHPEHDLVFRSYVGNEEKSVIEVPETNGTELPDQREVPIAPSIPTPQYSGDKKSEVTPVTPILSPPSLIQTPPAPPQPRLRSVIPLENGSTQEIAFPDESGEFEDTRTFPLPPLPRSNEVNPDGDSNKTQRRGLLPGLFPRK